MLFFNGSLEGVTPQPGKGPDPSQAKIFSALLLALIKK